MLFTLKPTILLALALTAIASPIANPNPNPETNLVARAAVKAVDCNGVKFTTTDINNALKEAKVVQTAKDDGKKGYGKYPEYYGNAEKLFTSTSNLYEYPLVDGTYSGTTSAGEPGKYRVIMNEKYKYMGSVYHPAGTGNTFKLCTNTE
ncbi:Ribonuclease/ribotoxin [Aspergillus ellipticus CBS 707.79]|uniref:Ribonuclease/ribotoxin n=1 Tax=Aspergillus ellipticus CBS 707.79 TaxID=1448320 RepID=A0A319DR39_9EURO|nr:Ribonuclease/ribotoxin [Aspergillus ellipticus CBS 707.79]